MRLRDDLPAKRADGPTPDRFTKLPKVMEIACLIKTTIYRLARRGEFPKPFKASGASSRWNKNEVRAWFEARKGKREAA
jgi:predicted DNA-binding transcriptional regulator AlpA